MIDLSSYSSIQTNLFITIDIPDFEVLTFSDYSKDYSIGNVNYVGLGQLLSVSQTASDLRAAPQGITISISGIPPDNISDIMDNKIRGSEVDVKRAFFDPITGNLIAISGNPIGKFQGIVARYEITDALSMGDDTGTLTINLECSSFVELLQNKIAGRRTNPIDQNIYYPSDRSMDRVPSLVKSNFNFGAPV